MNREEIFSHRKNKFLSIGRKKGFVSKIGFRRQFNHEREIFHIKFFINFKKFKYPTILIAFCFLILWINCIIFYNRTAAMFIFFS